VGYFILSHLFSPCSTNYSETSAIVGWLRNRGDGEAVEEGRVTRPAIDIGEMAGQTRQLQMSDFAPVLPLASHFEYTPNSWLYRIRAITQTLNIRRFYAACAW